MNWRLPRRFDRAWSCSVAGEGEPLPGYSATPPGCFELAEGGTIFLDEIGELPPETQVALLRVLQEREFERVGGNANIRAEVRVIAATNRDLEEAVAAGTFRSDLYYRLNVFPIEIPPLRERREDIPLLVEYFIDRYARKAGKSIQRINKRSLELLQAYPWPGAIRELQNVIERSVIVCESENFSVDESWLSRQPQAAESRGNAELSAKVAVCRRNLLIEAAQKRAQVGCPDHWAQQPGWASHALPLSRRSGRSESTRTASDRSTAGEQTLKASTRSGSGLRDALGVHPVIPAQLRSRSIHTRMYAGLLPFDAVRFGSVARENRTASRSTSVRSFRSTTIWISARSSRKSLFNAVACLASIRPHKVKTTSPFASL